MHWGYAVLAAIQLGIQVYGAWKGQKAAEAKADAEKKRLANLKRLAIKKYAHEEGVASKNLSLLDRKEIRESDIEKNVIFEEMVKQKKIEGKVLATAGMQGKSSSFYQDRITGDLLREQSGIKENFLWKRIELYSKKESVIEGLAAAKINMEYGIAGLTPPSTPDKSLMWLQVGNAALDAYGTYHKYDSTHKDTS